MKHFLPYSGEKNESRNNKARQVKNMQGKRESMLNKVIVFKTS